MEQTYRVSRRGAYWRPFVRQAQIGHRDLSGKLQRVTVDFGMEQSFARGSAQLQEHYGIAVPASRVRRVTLHHAQAAAVSPPPSTPRPVVDQLITQMDGSMVPLVQPKTMGSETPVDRRKHKVLKWEEARLCLARAEGSASPLYGVTLSDSVLAAGLVWEATAQRAGLGAHTQVHGVGDGAEWIRQQFDRQFGSQGYYLIDFYHVGDYLSAAAPYGDPAWFKQQQRLLFDNQVERVLSGLAPRREANDVQDEAAPVRKAMRYLSNRKQHLDYRGAKEKGLPIGSGQIEGSHRHVIQARLKKPGAWWLRPHAANMLALRVLRANGDWETYWKSVPNQQN